MCDMGVKISREIFLGSGSRGFRFKNQPETHADQERYEKGLELEKARLSGNSLGSEIYDRLSAVKIPDTNTR